jgi:hypothetical protein
MARWLADGSHVLAEWEPDLSSQTGASQAGILLGSNDDIPAFRWVEKERQVLMVCSSPEDCAEIERRHTRGPGLLANGGASRGNLFSGGADHVILTVSRMEAEPGAQPRLSRLPRQRLQRRAGVRPLRGRSSWSGSPQHASAGATSARAATGAASIRSCGRRCSVIVRDLIVYGVLMDMMKEAAIHATFSSYDEVAHHSGLEREDTLEALRKLDQQFARIEGARRYAARPYELVVLSDHGQTQGATFKQRNGYGLEDLGAEEPQPRRSHRAAGGDEQDAMVGHRRGRGDGAQAKRAKNDVPAATSSSSARAISASST